MTPISTLPSWLELQLQQLMSTSDISASPPTAVRAEKPTEHWYQVLLMPLFLQATLSHSPDKHFHPSYLYVAFLNLYLYSILIHSFEAELATSVTLHQKKKYFCAPGCISWLSILSATWILDPLIQTNLQTDTSLPRKSWCEPRFLHPGAVSCTAALILSIYKMINVKEETSLWQLLLFWVPGQDGSRRAHQHPRCHTAWDCCVAHHVEDERE